ncbi:MAG TPA: exosortase/archaeosortase family protein [archaeon]|nr:exosortase/archaeosortase family protein [archaeon]
MKALKRRHKGGAGGKGLTRGQALDLAFRYVAFTAFLALAWDWNPQFLIDWTRDSAVSALRFLGYPVLVNGDVFSGPGISIQVIQECASYLAYVVLLALFAYTGGLSWKERLKLWAKGALILFPLNTARLVFIFWTGETFGEKLALDVHLFIWQVMMAPLLVVLWFWLMKFERVRLPWVYDAELVWTSMKKGKNR